MGGQTDYDVYIHRVLGGFPFAELTMPSTPTTSQTPTWTLDEAFFWSLDQLLLSVAKQNLGPTRTSRILYLWFFTTAAGFSWIQSSSRLSSTHDTWNWDIHHPLSSTNDQFVFMNHLFVEVLASFIPTLDTTYLLEKERETLGWSTETQQAEVNRIQQTGAWSDWLEAWNDWYTYRGSDGSVAAAAVPPNSALPNGAQTLNVSTTTDDPNTFPEPQKWVPLIVGGIKRNYLTYGWGDVLSSCLTTEQETALKTTAGAAFPDTDERTAEIAELVSLNAQLTDTQKTIAEFWAGGPFTASPPGQLIWLWRQYVLATMVGHQNGMDILFFSGLDLAIHLFEVGRLVWDLKKTYMQARPIQEIRRTYRGQTIGGWNGIDLSGEAWIPYQAANFVTPPFPDFPSGHSAFSRVFALVMESWFGASISNIQFTYTHLKLVSVSLPDSQTQPFGTFLFPAGGSEVEPGVVPVNEIQLSWPTWSSMAESSGISRQYGGIHAVSAHTGSVALANALTADIQSTWNIQH